MIIDAGEIRGGRAVIASSAHTHCARCGYRVKQPDISKGALAALLREHGWSDTRREGWLCPWCIQRERSGLP